MAQGYVCGTLKDTGTSLFSVFTVLSARNASVVDLNNIQGVGFGFCSPPFAIIPPRFIVVIA